MDGDANLALCSHKGSQLSRLHCAFRLRPPHLCWHCGQAFHGIGGIVASIAASQAVDPGSIPGQCML